MNRQLAAFFLQAEFPLPSHVSTKRFIELREAITLRTLLSLLLSFARFTGCNRTWTSDALERGDVDSIKQHVLANPEYIHSRDSYGNTPLLTAIAFDNLELVQFLLLNGADPNVAVDDGYTCLLTAVESDSPNSISIVNSLIKAGADIHKTGTNGWTPLHLASARGHLEKAQFLILNGAHVNQRKQIDGFETPLMEAAFTGQSELVRFLLENGADASMRDTDNNLTPLEIAHSIASGPDPDVYNYLKDVDELLSEMDVPPEILVEMKRTMQNVDMAENYLENSNSLIESGNHTEVIEILTEHGIDERLD